MENKIIKKIKIIVGEDNKIKIWTDGMSKAEVLGTLKIAHTEILKTIFKDEKDKKN